MANVSALNTLCEGANEEDKISSATLAVMEGLYKVKVSKTDATKMERELEGELFDSWTESCETSKATMIPFYKITDYMDHLQKDYEGIDEELRKKMNGVLFTEGTWENKLIEWKFNKGDNSGARYGIIAFGRSEDKKYVDCMFVMYRMDFKIADEKIETLEQHSLFWGLVNWTTKSTEYHVRQLGAKTIKTLQNFFRIKALEGFYKEGIIEKINYVDSLDDIPDAS